MPYNLVEVYERFGGTYFLHLQVRRVSLQSRTKNVSLNLHVFFFGLEDRSNMFLCIVAKLLPDYKASHVTLSIVTNMRTQDF
jgi:hypothetical protein